jgi:hypothetical protein
MGVGAAAAAGIRREEVHAGDSSKDELRAQTAGQQEEGGQETKAQRAVKSLGKNKCQENSTFWKEEHTQPAFHNAMQQKMQRPHARVCCPEISHRWSFQQSYTRNKLAHTDENKNKAVP